MCPTTSGGIDPGEVREALFFFCDPRNHIMAICTFVTRALVPEDRRLEITHQLFGFNFPFRMEPVVLSLIHI